MTPTHGRMSPLIAKLVTVIGGRLARLLQGGDGCGVNPDCQLFRPSFRPGFGLELIQVWTGNCPLPAQPLRR